MRPTDQLSEWEWIEAYHQGKLPANERLVFEQELARDPDFRETTEQLHQADQALRTLALEQTVRQAVRKELSAGQPQRRWRLGRAVSTVALGAVLFVGYLTFNRVDLKPYRNDITLTQRYRELNDVSQANELTPRQRAFYRDFFDAQSYLANGQPDLAIGNLEKLARADSLRPYFKQAVQWHLINAYLLSKQPDNADTTWQLLNQAEKPVYPIDPADRWKVWWQIRWQKLTS